MGLSETSSRLTPSRKPRPLGPLEKSSSFLQRSLRELHENRSGSLVAPGSGMKACTAMSVGSAALGVAINVIPSASCVV